MYDRCVHVCVCVCVHVHILPNGLKNHIVSSQSVGNENH